MVGEGCWEPTQTLPNTRCSDTIFDQQIGINFSNKSLFSTRLLTHCELEHDDVLMQEANMFDVCVVHYK